MRVWLQKVVKNKRVLFVMAAFMVALQPLYGVITAPTAGATAQVVSGNTSTWMFNRDTDTSTPYHFTTAEAKTGYGSLYVEPIGINPSDKFIAEYFNKTAIDQLKSISYDFQIAGNGTTASADQFYLNVYATIDASDTYYDCRFDYVPTIGSATTFKKASFKTTDTPTRVAKRGDRIAACPATLAEMPAGSHMRAFALSVGDTGASDAGLAGYLDNVVVKKVGDVETYDFERPLPEVSYVLPSATNSVFRPSDNPIRVKVDDAEQVERVRFSLYEYDAVANEFGSHVGNFAVNRAKCDLAAAGNYIRCDIQDANNWTDLAEGTYAVKLTVFSGGEATIRTKMSEYWSQSFTVDATKPTFDSLTLENPVNGITNENVTVAATASDTLGVESVNFYMTLPRVADGVCTGNDPKLVESRTSTLSADGKYRVTLDTSVLEGEYCITAVARDSAKNNSAAQHVKVIVDHTAPTLNVTTPTDGDVFGNGQKINVASYMEDAWGLEQYFIDIVPAASLTAPAVADMPDEADPTPASAASLDIVTIFNADDFANGEYVIVVRVTDKAGNVTEETRTIFIKHTTVVPGQGGGTGVGGDSETDTLTQLAERLTQPFSVPHSFASSTGGSETNQQVLGLESDDKTDVAGGEQVVAAAPSTEGWKLFGVAWYWWLLFVAVLGVITAWIVRRVRPDDAA
jgi:hypothetical protein